MREWTKLAFKRLFCKTWKCSYRFCCNLAYKLWDLVILLSKFCYEVGAFLKWAVHNLIPRVSLLPILWSELEREREREPGMVWSRVSEKIEDVREGSLYFNILLPFVLSLSKRAAFVFTRECGQPLLLVMFYSSLNFAILTSNYNNINVKAKQVKCL